MQSVTHNNLEDLDEHDPPCMRVSSHQYYNQDVQLAQLNLQHERNRYETFGLSFSDFNPMFKLILCVRYYDIKDFIRNTRGYIGMFFDGVLNQALKAFIQDFICFKFFLLKLNPKNQQRNSKKTNHVY